MFNGWRMPLKDPRAFNVSTMSPDLKLHCVQGTSNASYFEWPAAATLTHALQTVKLLFAEVCTAQ